MSDKKIPDLKRAIEKAKGKGKETTKESPKNRVEIYEATIPGKGK